MRVVAGGYRPVLPPVAVGASLLVLTVAVASNRLVFPAAAFVIVLAAAFLLIRPLLRWHVLLGSLILMMLLVPVKRYDLPVQLPFHLEPYRIMIGLIAAAWMVSLLIDPRVRLRSSPFDVPLAMWFGAAMLSIATNQHRIEQLGVGSLVIKKLSTLLAFVLVFYLFVGLVRTRAHIELMVKLLTVGGSIVAFFGLVEYRTRYDVFNHLHMLLPVLQYHDPSIIGLNSAYLYRAGTQRVYASAEHPIELSATLVMLVPLAIYLFKSTGRRRWLVSLVLLTIGALATVSRTGIIMLIAAFVVFRWLRPVDTKRVYPILVPALVLVYVALPHSIGTFYGAFFPKHGLIAEQSQTVKGNGLVADGRLARIKPSLQELVDKGPVFGEGYGTRVATITAELLGIKRNARILDNEWLYSLLETGIVGAVGIFWLFRRSIRRLARVAREDDSADGWLAVALAASLTAFAVAMLTFDAFGFLQCTFVLFTLFALSACLLNLRREAPLVVR